MEPTSIKLILQTSKNYPCGVLILQKYYICVLWEVKKWKLKEICSCVSHILFVPLHVLPL